MPSPNVRSRWLALATEAARDPSRASQFASVLLDRIDTEARTGERAPEGYLYAGAHTLIARARNVPVEPLPTPAAPRAVPIWDTSNNVLDIKIPFDVWIYAVAGWAASKTIDVEGGPLVNAAPAAVTAADGRDLFSVEWGLDGSVWMMTDGRRRKMQPASCVVGTRRVPRRMSLTLRRNQILQVRVRNLWNVIQNTWPTQEEYPELAEVAVAFYAVNLEAP